MAQDALEFELVFYVLDAAYGKFMDAQQAILLEAMAGLPGRAWASSQAIAVAIAAFATTACNKPATDAPVAPAADAMATDTAARVLERACQDLAGWQRHGGRVATSLSVAVNMSAVQFRQAGLARRVGEIVSGGNISLDVLGQLAIGN